MILKPLVHLGDRFLLFSTFVQKKEEEEIATYRPAAAGKNSESQWKCNDQTAINFNSLKPKALHKSQE